ncbi:MAG TPA: YihY/virulence factor BrkB family protein [Steroidobacteraceae bacterium]|jgi:membrane protein
MNARFGFGIVKLTRRSVNAWFSHDAASRGASLSFYTLFALAPVLLIATWVGETILGKDSVNRSIVAQLQALIGDAGASAVSALLEGSMHFGNGVARSVIGFVSLLVGATSVFAELQRALNTVWGTHTPIGARGIWQSLRTRILSFGLILGMGFLLLVSLIISAALSALGVWLGSVIAQWTQLLSVVNTLLGLGIATLLFAMIYKFLPNRTIAWGDVWVGALVTAGLFMVGKLLIGLYLSKSAFTSGYGAAGSLLVLLLWIYYSAQIFLFGAEFTHAFAYEHGSQRRRFSSYRQPRRLPT